MLNHQREGPATVTCQNHLKQIYTACVQYKDTHGQGHFYPRSLSDLAESETPTITELRLFICPKDRHPQKRGTIEMSYECAFDLADHPLTDSFPKDLPMAWDRQAFHVKVESDPRNVERKHGRNVLRFDGSAKLVFDEQEFAAELQQLKDELAKEKAAE